MTGSALLLTALVRQRPWPVGRPVALALAATAGWVALLATAAWFGGSLTIGVIATICATVAAWPQVRTLRDRSVDPAGVSPAMWWLGLTSSTLWTLYGLLVSSVPITVCSLVNLILGIAVLVSLRRLNRRSWTAVRLAAA